MRDINGLSYREIAQATETPVGTVMSRLGGARAMLAKTLRAGSMTDRDANQRLLRLNAALDGELDAMGSLEFERELRDDPALAAEYRRLDEPCVTRSVVTRRVKRRRKRSLTASLR